MNPEPSTALPSQRRAAIARMVAEGNAARAVDLATKLNVNVATIRRDLQRLEEEGSLRRVRGGAVAAVSPGDLRSGPQPWQPRIGRAVVEMIADGETVFLGPGELTLEVARCLSARARVSVVTNSLEVAYWTAKNTSHTVIITGGQVEGRGLGLVGALTRMAFASLRADHVILEMGGANPVDGLTDDSLSQAEISRMLLESGSKVIALVPVDRVGRVAAAYVAPATEADVLVTAREVPSALLWDLTELGVRIVLA